MRLIDADRCLEHIGSIRKSTWYTEHADDYGMRMQHGAVDYIEDHVIRSAITVDPVKHGEWVGEYADHQLERMTHFFKCSACGGEIYMYYPTAVCTDKFCRHCGADMQEVRQ